MPDMPSLCTFVCKFPHFRPKWILRNFEPDAKEVSFESLLNLGQLQQSVQSTHSREMPSLSLATYFNGDHSLPTDQIRQFSVKNANN